jgi:iron complex outermembrane receptor protein
MSTHPLNPERRRPLRRRCALAACLAGLALTGQAARAAPQTQVAALADLSLEDLGDLRVTSVTGRPASVHDAAASIFVIRAEDIRRSAATSLAEALRLAPNLQVARSNASQYAISARGFNNAIGNKLLVLIDGRIVYSPLFSGVFWDAQGVVLEDIERIEVISGPGATLWGANAVNGVINIISKSAGATAGAYAAVTAGSTGSVASARYGAAFGSHGHYRVYATRDERDASRRADGSTLPDATERRQMGFRADWAEGQVQARLQGDVYGGGLSTASNLAPRMSGGNLLGVWARTLPDGSNWQLQAYLDQVRRDDDILFRERTRTVALDFSYVPATSPEHRVILGGGHRRSRSEAQPTAFFRFVPTVRQLAWTNLFVQDEVRLDPALKLTVGAKLESNVYTGVELLPTLRLAREIGASQVVWAALSRAVRAPARLDRDLFLPATPPFLITGGPDFASEVANVAEFGYRAQPTPQSGVSVTVFHHEYSKLRAGSAAPTFIENRVAGHTQGVEAWGHWDASPAWRLSAGLLALHKDLHAAAGSPASSVPNLGNDPTSQWTLNSRSELGEDWELDVAVRHVAALPEPALPAYTAADLRLAWQATPSVTLSLLVQNLLDRRHAEFEAPATASQSGRRAFARLEWRLP